MMTTRTFYDTDNRVNYPNKSYSNSSGVITKQTKSGSYNVIEKDYGDHKRIYHVPIEYGDDYDLSQLDEPNINTDPVKSSPRLVRRRIYHEYDNHQNVPYNEDYLVEQTPNISSRRVYVSPRRNQQRETEIVQRFYDPVPAPIKKVEYIYEDDHANIYEYRPETEPQVEYFVREQVPQRRIQYVEEVRPTHRRVYVEEPNRSQSNERPMSMSPNGRSRGPIQYSPPHVRRSPIPVVPGPPGQINNIPAIASISSRFNSMSPPPSHRQAPTTRNLPLESARSYESSPLRLMDVVAQNRARRGTRLPKPRREVDETKNFDPPTYNRNVIKNGFIVHK